MVAAREQELDRLGPYIAAGLRFHQRETNRRALRSQPLPPPVERVLPQTPFAAERADRLPARFLLCDPLAPQLPPLFRFPLTTPLCRSNVVSASGVHVMLTLREQLDAFRRMRER